MPIISNRGKAHFHISLPLDPSEQECYAATQLQHYLSKVSQAQFEINRESIRDSNSIRLQSCNSGDSYRIGVTDNNITIEGGDRGLLYGVYDFLERFTGCRWYSPEITVVPKCRMLRIAEGEYSASPAFISRDTCYYHAVQNPDWAAMARLNGNSLRQQRPEHGGRVAFAEPSVHNCHFLVSRDYFDEHPEYFALVDGERKAPGYHLCFSNPEVIRIAAETMISWMDDNPDCEVFAAEQDDGGFCCECENCKAIEEREGSYAGTVLHWVNGVAEICAEIHPDKCLMTLAYSFSQIPPKQMKVHPNVIIRFAHLLEPKCGVHPFDECDMNNWALENLALWKGITEKVFVWHYATNFWNYLVPFANFESLPAAYRHYQDLGITHIYTQGNRQSPHGEFAELRTWLAGKLMWDPTLDATALIDEFLKAYYGGAWRSIRKYIHYLHQRISKAKTHMYCLMPCDSYLTLRTINAASRILDRAFEKVDQDSPEYERLLPIKLSVLFTRLVLSNPDLNPNQHQRFIPPDSWDQRTLDAATEFIDLWEVLDFPYVTEMHWRVTAWQKRMASLYQFLGRPVPDGATRHWLDQPVDAPVNSAGVM